MQNTLQPEENLQPDTITIDGYRFMQVYQRDTPDTEGDEICYEYKNEKLEVGARFSYVFHQGYWIPRPGVGIEIFDPKMRQKGIGEKMTMAIHGKYGPVRSTAMTEQDGTSPSAQNMWQRLEKTRKARVIEILETDPDLGTQTCWTTKMP